MKVSAIITAAGDGSRFGKNKMLALLNSEPILIRTLKQFKKSKRIKEMIVAAKKEDIEKCKRLIKKANLKARVIEGGPERFISAYNGVKVAKSEFVVIHDGVRPLIPVWLIDKVAEETVKYGAVMAAAPATTCVKFVKDLIVKKSLPRSKTWLGQTPHGFKKELIIKAYEKALKDKYFSPSDDCELVMRLGKKVKVVSGSPINIKVTHPSDLKIAEQLFAFLNEKNV